MSAIIHLFDPSRPRHGGPRGWTTQELAELTRVRDILARSGLAIDTDQGVTDEGDPWFVFTRSDCGEVIAHFARIAGTYHVASTAVDLVLTGRSFRELVNALAERQPLMMPLQKPAGQNVYTPPFELLTALVATSFLLSQPETGVGSPSASSPAAELDPEAEGAAQTPLQKLSQALSLALAKMHAATSTTAPPVGGDGKVVPLSPQSGSDGGSFIQQVTIVSLLATALSVIHAGRVEEADDLLTVAARAIQEIRPDQADGGPRQAREVGRTPAAQDEDADGAPSDDGARIEAVAAVEDTISDPVALDALDALELASDPAVAIDTQVLQVFAQPTLFPPSAGEAGAEDPATVLAPAKAAPTGDDPDDQPVAAQDAEPEAEPVVEQPPAAVQSAAADAAAPQGAQTTETAPTAPQTSEPTPFETATASQPDPDVPTSDEIAQASAAEATEQITITLTVLTRSLNEAEIEDLLGPPDAPDPVTSAGPPALTDPQPVTQDQPVVPPLAQAPEDATDQTPGRADMGALEDAVAQSVPPALGTSLAEATPDAPAPVTSADPPLLAGGGAPGTVAAQAPPDGAAPEAEVPPAPLAPVAESPDRAIQFVSTDTGSQELTLSAIQDVIVFGGGDVALQGFAPETDILIVDIPDLDPTAVTASVDSGGSLTLTFETGDQLSLIGVASPLLA